LAALEEKLIDINLDDPSEHDLELIRDTIMEEIKDITGDIPPKLPPFREVNHAIPLIDPTKKYWTHPPRCPDEYQPALSEKINRYVTAGWWAPTTTASAVPKGTPRGPIFRFSDEVMCGYGLFTPGAQGTSPLWRYFCFLVFSDLGLLFSLLWTLPDGCKHLIPRT
jgi:hypothetical protein